MKNSLHVLAIDDHVVVLEGYLSIFKNLEIAQPHRLKFTKATDCKTGYEAIVNQTDPFDVAVIDYSIPNFPDKKLFSGEDIAMLVRNRMPQCKIIMMTMHKEMDLMERILHKVMPEGFINKSDCSTDELIDGFNKVMKNEIYHSKTVSDHIKRVEKGIVFDATDLKIIQLLSKGIKNKNLEKYIPLSSSAIEKRKYKLKRALDIKGDDEDLINTARKLGYI